MGKTGGEATAAEKAAIAVTKVAATAATTTTGRRRLISTTAQAQAAASQNHAHYTLARSRFKVKRLQHLTSPFNVLLPSLAPPPPSGRSRVWRVLGVVGGGGVILDGLADDAVAIRRGGWIHGRWFESGFKREKNSFFAQKLGRVFFRVTCFLFCGTLESKQLKHSTS